MLERTVLSNGLRLLVSPMPQTHSVSLGIFIGTGSRYEEDAIAGASHFIEHMLFKGTRKWPTAKDLAVTIEGIGGIINAGTAREMTNYWVKVAQPHFPVAMDVLADMLRQPLFAEEEIEKERQVIIEEIKMTLDTPDELVQLVISELQWPNNPIGRDIAGTRESVGSLTRERILRYMDEHYGPGNTVLAIAGNVTLEGILGMVEDHFDDWRGGSRHSYLPFDSVQDGPRVNTVYRPTEQANVCMSVPALARNDPDRFVLRLLNAVLGEGMSSRLFQEIREKRGLAYNVESYIETLDETGVIGAYAGVDPGRVDQALQAILDEWSRIQQEPVLEDELNKAREFVKGRLLLRMEDTFAVAAWNGQQELLQNEVMTVEEVIAALDAVTPAQIQALAGKLFAQTKVNLGIVGPFGSEENSDRDRFRQLLARWR
jgi:predicted Zn-dependent peptidase